MADNGLNEKAMFLDKSTHPAPEPGDSLNHLCSSPSSGEDSNLLWNWGSRRCQMLGVGSACLANSASGGLDWLLNSSEGPERPVDSHCFTGMGDGQGRLGRRETLGAKTGEGDCGGTVENIATMFA